MSLRICLLLIGVGILLWGAGSIYYAYRGPQVLETTCARYWLALILSSVFTACIVAGVLKCTQVAPAHWASGALLVAIPGMLGEAIVLSHLSIFMPGIHLSSGGRYGAFLFAVYAAVLGLAEIITLRATI